MSTSPWFDEYGWLIKPLPPEAIHDCHHQGACDEDVTAWRKELNFTVPRERAIAWLAEFGAWDDEELAVFTDERLAETVLGLAAGDIQEQGEWAGLVH